MGGFAKVMNKVPMAVLRSPLHHSMSGKYLLLTFTGRKSGRMYTTPVAYLKEEETFLMTTDSPWWKNLRGRDGAGTPVTVWVKGREYEGIGEAVTDETEVAHVLDRFLQMQPGYGKFVGVKGGAGGWVDPSMLEEAARGRVVVRVRPTRARVGSSDG
jgi:F420H(2)-dependent quinone reductase